LRASADVVRWACSNRLFSFSRRLNFIQNVGAMLCDELLFNRFRNQSGKGRMIGFVHYLNAMFLELIEIVFLCVNIHLPLRNSHLFAKLKEKILHFLWEGCEFCVVHAQRSRSESVAGQRKMVLNFIKPGIQNQCDRIFLTINRARFQCCKQLSECHRCWYCAEKLEGSQMCRVRRGADLQAFYIVGGYNRPSTIG